MDLICPHEGKPIILAVEDQVPVLQVLEALLDIEGLQVHGAVNGSDALQLVQKITPDLILLDLTLPDMNGHTLFEAFQGMDRLKDTPVAFLTGQSSNTHRLKALEAGAVDYINKPFAPEELVARVKTHLRQKFLRDQQRIDAEKTEEEAEAAILRANLRFNALAKGSSDLFCELDEELKIVYLSDNLGAASQIFGQSRAGDHFLQWIDPDFQSSTESQLKEALATHEDSRFETRATAGTEAHWLDIATTFFQMEGGAPRLLLVCRDISDAKEYQEHLQKLAWFDTLTGLPNRNYMIERIEETLADPEAASGAAFIAIDLDNFKWINDTLGHQAGDDTLRRLAGVIKTGLRSKDLVGRMGGDEFCALLHDVDAAEAEAIAKNLINLIRGSVGSIGEGKFLLTLSIGIAVGHPGINYRELSLRADAALFAAKRSGKNRFATYKEESDAMVRLKGEVDWAGKIREGILSNRFAPWYQPIHAVAGGGLENFEALIRYTDEAGELHLPAEFLNAAERYNLMTDLDRYMIRHIFEQMEAVPNLKTSINLSGASIMEPDLAEFLQTGMAMHKILPSRLNFEITESILIGNLNLAKELMAGLQEAGCTFALDDFGAGFSSMGYLKNLSVDRVKIDGAFVTGITTDPIAAALLASINNIAHLLGKKTTAEYVSSQEILDKLTQYGIDSAQGHFLGKPMPLSKAIELLEKSYPAASSH